MAISGKVLADGQLASSKSTLYTVPVSTVGLVKYMSFFNTNTTNETVILYLNASGTSRRIARFVLGQNESAAIDCSLSLQAGDLIEAQTTTASMVDYVITGAESA